MYQKISPFSKLLTTKRKDKSINDIFNQLLCNKWVILVSLLSHLAMLHLKCTSGNVNLHLYSYLLIEVKRTERRENENGTHENGHGMGRFTFTAKKFAISKNTMQGKFFIITSGLKFPRIFSEAKCKYI